MVDQRKRGVIPPLPRSREGNESLKISTPEIGQGEGRQVGGPKPEDRSAGVILVGG